MHKNLPEWYQVASIVPPETLDKRSAAIELIVKNLDKVSALNLIRFFLGLNLSNEKYPEELGAEIQKSDPTFILKNSDVELRILAGAGIVNILETRSSDFAEVIALGLLSAKCLNLRDNIIVPEVVTIAEAFLLDRSVTIRQDSNLPDLSSLKFNEKQIKALRDKCKEGGHVGTIEENLAACFKELRSVLSKTSEAYAILKEESNILWWLFGESSRDLKMHIDKIKLPTASLIVGKELADFIIVSPGLIVSAKAILDKMLSFNTKEKKNTSFKKAINECPLEWRSSLAKGLGENLALNLTPILYSIVESIKFEDNTNWSVGVENQLHLDLNTSLEIQQVSFQIFIEMIFLKFLSRTEN